MSITKALRNKLNYSVFLNVFVGDFKICSLGGMKYIPFEEVFE